MFSLMLYSSFFRTKEHFKGRDFGGKIVCSEKDLGQEKISGSYGCLGRRSETRTRVGGS